MPHRAAMTPRDYIWGHAVNSYALLHEVSSAIRAATAAPATVTPPHYVNAVEADVIWSELQQTAVMGHPPQTDSELTLAAFLDEMQTLAALLCAHNKNEPTTAAPLIVKLDFKSMQAFQASSAVVHSFIAAYPFARGVFLNADILVGPATTHTIAFPDADSFVRDAIALCKSDRDAHKLVLSAGWTTSNATDDERRRTYSPAMVDAMLRVLAPYPNVYVTFPVRATSVRSSWPALEQLLRADSRKFGLTLWWAQTQMSDDELEWLVATLEDSDPELADRTFYDILGFERFMQRRDARNRTESERSGSS